MKKLAFLLLAAALGIAGCGGDDDNERAGAEPPTVASEDAPFDRAFIDAMVPHHQAAIAMAKEAKNAGLSEPELNKIADDIIATQQAEIDQMLEWRQQWFGSRKREPEAAALEALGLSPAEAGMEHSAADLAAADDVNQAFPGMMIGHHTGAIRMAETRQGEGRSRRSQDARGRDHRCPAARDRHHRGLLHGSARLAPSFSRRADNPPDSQTS